MKNKRNLLLAIQLLVETKLLVREIAAVSGFKNTAELTLVLKNTYSLTPVSIRKQFKNNVAFLHALFKERTRHSPFDGFPFEDFMFLGTTSIVPLVGTAKKKTLKYIVDHQPTSISVPIDSINLYWGLNSSHKEFRVIMKAKPDTKYTGTLHLKITDWSPFNSNT